MGAYESVFIATALHAAASAVTTCSNTKATCEAYTRPRSIDCIVRINDGSTFTI